jgi:hypothetical protein
VVRGLGVNEVPTIQFTKTPVLTGVFDLVSYTRSLIEGICMQSVGGIK